MLASIREASEFLGLSEMHIRRQIRLGRWPFYRLGPRAMRVDLEELKQLAKLVGKIEMARRKRKVAKEVQERIENGAGL